MVAGTQMLIALFIGIVLLILLILKTKVHAFLGLIIAAVVIGLLGVHAYSMGSFNLFTLTYTIGGDGMTNFFLACGCAALSFALGLVFTYLIGFKED